MPYRGVTSVETSLASGYRPSGYSAVIDRVDVDTSMPVKLSRNDLYRPTLRIPARANK